MPWSIFDHGGDAAALQYAALLLQAIGAPITPGNLTFVYQWEKSEGGGGVYNPLNAGATKWSSSGNQYGGGAADYPSLATSAQAVAWILETNKFAHYQDIVADLRANNGSQAAKDLWDSPWAGGHYGYGSHWSKAVPPGGTNLTVLPDPNAFAGASTSGTAKPSGGGLPTWTAILGPGGQAIYGSIIGSGGNPILGALFGALGPLLSKGWWLRMAEFGGGFLLVVIGIVFLLHKDAGSLITSVGKVAAVA